MKVDSPFLKASEKTINQPYEMENTMEEVKPGDVVLDSLASVSDETTDEAIEQEHAEELASDDLGEMAAEQWMKSLTPEQEQALYQQFLEAALRKRRRAASATKKKVTASQRKNKRKSQKAARRKNRK